MDRMRTISTFDFFKCTHDQNSIDRYFGFKYTRLDNLIMERNQLEIMKEKAELSVDSFIKDCSDVKFQRSKKPFKHIEYDGFIVFKKDMDLFYKGKYGKIIKVYYNLDTDTLSCDTSFAGEEIVDSDIKIKAVYTQKDLFCFCSKMIEKYNDAIQQWKNKYESKNLKHRLHSLFSD